MKEKLGHIEDKCKHSIMQLVVVPEGGNGDGGMEIIERLQSKNFQSARKTNTLKLKVFKFYYF